MPDGRRGRSRLRDGGDDPLLEVCARYYEPWFTGYGFGYFGDMPAAYALKYVTMVRPLCYDVLDGGYQGLWERVARGIDVRLGAQVNRVERGEGVTVHTSDGRHDFDELFLACPLDEAPAFLDADAEEVALFSRIRYHRYVSTLAAVAGPPLPRWGFFMDNLAPDRHGHPMFWYRRWPDRPIVNFFTLLGAGEEADRVDGAIDAALRRLGRSLGVVRGREVWQRYCPHLAPEDIAAGWFDRVERQQGRRRTFYTGEALSFGLVEAAAGYSIDLVERTHPPRGIAAHPAHRCVAAGRERATSTSGA